MRHEGRSGGGPEKVFFPLPGLWDAGTPAPGAYDELYKEPSKIEKTWVSEDDAQPLN